MIDGQRRVAPPAPGGTLATVSGEAVLFVAGEAWSVAAPTADRASGAAAGDGTILSPMPGRILAVAVAVGDAVVRGQRLVVVEAMKMEHALVAPFDGMVTELPVREGAQVAERAVLVVVAPA